MLRENALRVKNLRQNVALVDFKLGEDTEMAILVARLDEVLKATMVLYDNKSIVIKLSGSTAE